MVSRFKNYQEGDDKLFIIKNFRNYIPILGVFLLLMFLKFNSYIDWAEDTIILAFVGVPYSNFLATLLNIFKFKDGKKLITSILFSYSIQLIPLLIGIPLSDSKGGYVIIQYCIFLIVVDIIAMIYLLKKYRK